MDTIVFAHNGNYLDPLETGDKETVRFVIQYYKVSYNWQLQNLMLAFTGPPKRSEGGDEKGNSLLSSPRHGQVAAVLRPESV